VTLGWHGDFVRVPSWGRPDAAQELRGRGDVELAKHSIDFAIEPGNSFVSMLSVGFTYDKRDSAILPSRGTLATFLGDLASPLIGSDYQFIRLQASLNGWFPLKWGHTVRVGMFAGAVFGYAPFFYKFFVSDLTDLMPSRILGLNLDHRPAPNLFGVLSCGRVFDASCGTAVAQMRQEELAARVDAEYVWPLARGRHKFVKGADAYFLLGLYGLADPRDLQVAMPGYSGAARIPIDLTADIGVRLDTQIGVFQVGLAKLLWLPFN
jgi:outer membrane protein insertion porin family